MALFIWAQSTTGQPTSAQLAAVAQGVRNHLRDNLWPLLGFNMFLQIVRAQDFTHGPGVTRTSFPASTAGGAGVPVLTSNTALSLGLLTSPGHPGGPRGVYISGLASSVVEGNFIDHAFADACAAAWAGLSAPLAAAGMVHVQPSRYLDGAARPVAINRVVTGVVVRSYKVRNLRRRAAGYPAPL